MIGGRNAFVSIGQSRRREPKTADVVRSAVDDNDRSAARKFWEFFLEHIGTIVSGNCEVDERAVHAASILRRVVLRRRSGESKTIGD